MFAFWAAETAKRWDNDDLPRVRQQVDYVIGRLQELTADPNIEVQERVGVRKQVVGLAHLAKGRELSRALYVDQRRLVTVQTTTTRELRLRQ